MTPDVVVLLPLLFNSMMLWLAPTLSRPGVFFGVSVRPGFRDTAFARACVRRYRLAVVVGAAVAMAVITTTASPRARMLVLMLHTVAVYGTWVLMRRAVTPHVQLPADVRSAAVTPRDTRVPGGPLVLAGPFAIVALAALVVYANWDTVPEQFPSMRRGGSGRMVDRSVNTVFGPFVFTAALLVAFTLQTILLLKRTRQIAAMGPSFEAEALFKRRTVIQSIVASYLMAIGPSWFATRRTLGGDGTFGTADGLWLGAIVVLTIVFTTWAIRVGQGGQRQVPASAGAFAGDATPDTAWKGGLLYFNTADPAVFVEHRMGVGWSLNFGNAWSWILLGCGIGLPMLVLRLMR